MSTWSCLHHLPSRRNDQQTYICCNNQYIIVTFYVNMNFRLHLPTRFPTWSSKRTSFRSGIAALKTRDFL